MTEAGYSQEDAYIYKLEREQAEKRRREKSEAKPELKLLQGGKSESLPSLPSGARPLKKAG